jgi:LmbE family N-acetylglucosaminyl deacetylase
MAIRYQLRRKPKIVVLLLAFYLCIFIFLGYSGKSLFFIMLAFMYAFVLFVGVLSLYRIYSKEAIIHFDKPEKILIVAPHQDDCVISAGGFGIRNLQLGGETHIVYLTMEVSTDLAETRRKEAIEIWNHVGCHNLYHLDVLPKKSERNPKKIYDAANQLQSLIDKISPTILFVPLFEGGHVQHDITNHIISFLIKKPREMYIYECPEYSPYFSIRHTPHKVLGMLSRFFLIFVSYFGPPEGLDKRTILNLELDSNEIELKKRMLRAFHSQEGDSLAGYYGYPDRVIQWEERPYRPHPFEYRGSLAYFIQIFRKTSFQWLVKRLFPYDYKSVGLAQGITNLDDELILKK